MIRNVLENLQFYPNAEKINLRIDVPADFQLTTDLARFQIIVSNLISNAFKYSDPAKGNSFIDIIAILKQDQLELAIKDNGLGIQSKYIENIFDMFYQANERSEGSGPGFVYCKTSC
ncbi:MAG: HAMP domain-containing sensor histidine kinase [Cytophagales bacterium]|nr:HAMP domain-containing sensor histidine kinase [Cytophagales bacterium]